MIVGTAGHIDHGKTSLIRRLTGIDTDRLKEEKARGISIDLGFAYWPRSGGDIIGFVDVPGHESLVHNMLAGAAGIDFVMLVVAANDGIMPQTLEHLAIIELLGLDRGLVALNKCDLADDARIRQVADDIKKLLRSTRLADADIVPVSATAGAGVQILQQKLDEAQSKSPARSGDGLFRLAVDRCFTLAGQGTAVTGTVLSGSVTIGDDVVVSPSGLTARVRSIHAQNMAAERGVAGQRCALVLAGPRIAKDTVRRGDMIVTPLLHEPTNRIDVRVKILPSEPKPIGQWFPVKLHHAATEVPGRLVSLNDGTLHPGETTFAQLVLERPIAAAAGDRFVIRDTSSSRTVGGGVFVDVRAPERKRRTPERHRVLAALAHSDTEAALEDVLSVPGATIDLTAFARDRALTLDSCQLLATRLGQVMLPTPHGVTAMSQATWQSLTSSIGAELDRFHAENPDQPGIGLEQLRRAYKPLLAAPHFLAAVRRLTQEGHLALDRTWVRRSGHVAFIAPADEHALTQVLANLDAEPYRPPRVRDIAKSMSLEESHVRRLLRLSVRRGDTEEIAHDHYFTRATVERIASIAIEIAAKAPDGRFSAADLRDKLDNGRKVAIQILEFFDRHGFTIRRQDLRRINPARIEFFAPKLASNENGGVPFPVGRPDFKSGWGRQTVLGGFDSHPPPPSSKASP